MDLYVTYKFKSIGWNIDYSGFFKYYSVYIIPTILFLSSFIEFKAVDIFIIVIFSGIISGIISGTICKLEMSQGGIVLLSHLQKRF